MYFPHLGNVVVVVYYIIIGILDLEIDIWKQVEPILKPNQHSKQSTVEIVYNDHPHDPKFGRC